MPASNATDTAGHSARARSTRSPRRDAPPTASTHGAGTWQPGAQGSPSERRGREQELPHDASHIVDTHRSHRVHANESTTRHRYRSPTGAICQTRKDESIYASPGRKFYLSIEKETCPAAACVGLLSHALLHSPGRRGLKESPSSLFREGGGSRADSSAGQSLDPSLAAVWPPTTPLPPQGSGESTHLPVARFSERVGEGIGEKKKERARNKGKRHWLIVLDDQVASRKHGSGPQPA